MPNYAKVKRIFYLLGQLGKTSHRDDMISEVTNGRVWSTKDMTDQEAQDFIARLEQMLSNKTQPKPEPKADDPANKMRRKVISKCIEMRAITADGKADMEWIYKFIKTKFKKGLNTMSMGELGKVISVLETKWLPWFYQRKDADQAFTIKRIELEPKQEDQK
jgi:hypothetical protein